jgi:hypothetical protein
VITPGAIIINPAFLSLVSEFAIVDFPITPSHFVNATILSLGTLFDPDACARVAVTFKIVWAAFPPELFPREDFLFLAGDTDAFAARCLGMVWFSWYRCSLKIVNDFCLLPFL